MRFAAVLPGYYTMACTEAEGYQMAGNVLSYSEYLKCNNACVKVTITRYRNLGLRTLTEVAMRLQELFSEPRLCDFLHRLRPRLLSYVYSLHAILKELEGEPEEIHHGSGFLIADRFAITSWHVVEEAMSDKTLKVCILNETISELSCEVVHCDAVSDLALLYCHGLSLKRHGICPLDLSEEALWPSLPVFSFGYPFTHTGRSALFVEGKVSGSKDRYGREPFVVLNCALNPGNSGGPVFRRSGDDIKVVGVVAQKHKKEILTLQEISILEEERSTLNSASDSKDQFWKSVSLKMYDALNETHCQFGYGNMVPGHLVVKFLSDPSVTSIMEEEQRFETID